MRQTVTSWVMEDRTKARVAAPIPNRARTVAWANQARIVQGRANNSQEVLMEREVIYVGWGSCEDAKRPACEANGRPARVEAAA